MDLLKSVFVIFPGAPGVEQSATVGAVGGIAPFLTVFLELFGTRPQCPDDAATETMKRKKSEE